MSRRSVWLCTNGVIGGWLRTTTGTSALGRVKPLLLYRGLHSASRMVDQVVHVNFCTYLLASWISQ
jgi:hypothetical protein